MGVAFFNVLEIPCFVLKEQETCVAWHWWGGYVAARLESLPSQQGNWTLKSRDGGLRVLQHPCIVLRLGEGWGFEPFWRIPHSLVVVGEKLAEI